MILKGKAHVFGDDINTDYIISGKYKFKTLDMNELGKHVMEDIDPNFSQKVKVGDFIVAGKNFGCGSSREHAPLVIKLSGIKCIIAESFARIFFRNAINIGLPILECAAAAKDIEKGDLVEADIKTGRITNITKGRTYQAESFPEFMREIMKAEGLINYVRKRGKGL